MIKKIKFFYIAIIFLALIRVLLIAFFNNHLYNSESLKENGKIINIIKKDNRVVIDIKNDKKYRVYINEDDFKYELGDVVNVYGLFETISNNTIFNLFNYKKYMLSKNISMVCYDCKIKLVRKNRNIFYKIKNNIIDHIDKCKSSSYLYDFIIGDSSYINEEIKEVYSTLGISYLFSLSSLHISLLVIFMEKTLNKKNKLFKMLFMFLYLFLSGFKESFIRCTLFLMLSIINKKLKLKMKNVQILIFLASIILIYNPYFIYNGGFLFSFIVTFFIFLSKKYTCGKNYLYKTIFLSIICFLSSLPIVISSYYKINLLTVIYTIILTPFVLYIIYPLSLIVFIFMPLDNLLMFIICIFEKSCMFLSRFNILSFTVSKPNIIVFILYYVFLYLAIKHKPKYVTLFILLLVININSRFLIINPKITFLDVGQGDSSIFIFKGGKTVVIDTGGNYLSSSMDKKEKRIIPYLNSMGIKQIEYLILTHGDYDHMGEAINLVNNIKIENVILNCGPYNDLEKDLIKVLEDKKIKYYSCIKELNIDKHKFQFLNTGIYDNENDNSSVIYFDYNNYKFLLMGDASVKREKDILEKYNLKNIDFLKIGHHGSKTSSGKEFIDEISPKYSIISVGKSNRYGHPNKEVLNNLDGSKIYRTDIDGSVMFRIKNNKLKIKTCSP